MAAGAGWLLCERRSSEVSERNCHWDVGGGLIEELRAATCSKSGAWLLERGSYVSKRHRRQVGSVPEGPCKYRKRNDNLGGIESN
ncbi:hypothetical protein NDU88_008609 [Pleurodeles waltl]|uniref:Uncharacterized protein n=1 Tax=Pleurodeles waltl TaxID=8319 RepID=A0AAV7RXD6_PLEWA|nr:hypothetical protein NDU88_008609 [Pleurodeles waltl]